MNIQEIIDRLIAFHPSEVDEKHTGDVVKFGRTDVPCTGIVTTVCATVDVIRRAGELGANLIIVHEPLFYSDADSTDWLENNTVYQEKVKLLEGYGITVWRDHDHFHGGSPKRERRYPDMVFEGIGRELGWTGYCVNYPMKPLVYEIPETTGMELIQELVEKLHLNGARLIGDPHARVRRVFFAEHVNGHGWDGQNPDNDAISEIETNGYDVIIPFEIVDWTVSGYVRDAAQLGHGKLIIEMGHFNTEELAMRQLAHDWLPEVIDRAVPVQFVQSGDLYSYYVSKRNPIGREGE